MGFEADRMHEEMVLNDLNADLVRGAKPMTTDKTMEAVKGKIFNLLWDAQGSIKAEHHPNILTYKILSLPEIAILHPDQSLPEIPSSFYGLVDVVGAYQKAQQDMKDWKRVL